MRVRLTDQALVAVALARRHAQATARSAHVADVVVGLGSEPEGCAGRLLAACSNAVAALADRTAAASPRLPSLEVVLGWVAGEVGNRPAGTIDLLLAALGVGGSDLADLLERCGLPVATLAAAPRPAETLLRDAVASGALAETYRLDPAEAGIEPAAARALARTRAVVGDALTLLAALAVEAATDPDAVPLEVDALVERLATLPEAAERTVRRQRTGQQDGSAEGVVDAAWRIRRPGLPLRALDLLRSAALVGGPDARLLLEGTGAGRRMP